MTDVEYLAQSLYEPNAYIVEGFNPGMIAVSKPPISLTRQEILAVIAYLQSLGGTPSVTLDTQLEYGDGTDTAQPAASPSTAAAATPAAATAGAQSADQLFVTYACVTCHNLDAPGPLVGPSLFDVGNRLTMAQIYESILNPDATLAEGFPGQVMSLTLEGMDFYNKVSAGELKAMVDYLSQRKGTP